MSEQTPTTLPSRQRAIGPIAATMASGDMPGLSRALEKGLDVGLSLGDVKEILVQLYAYTGFPRSLNALSELMKVSDARAKRGVKDDPGRAAGPVPVGQALLEIGTANQTRLAGSPVKGPLFDFAPAIDQFLKTHLFGDIFARDNLDWQSRELATVAALAAMPGVESQLLSHVRISTNTGLSIEQLTAFSQALMQEGLGDAGVRLKAAVDQHAGESVKR